MGFQTPQYRLAEYLERAVNGKIQLPDFQRGYKWDDERIRQLLVTVLRGHPMGVVMLLNTGNEQIRFKPRPVEGVHLPGGTEPEALLLDGQQRLTSLTQSLTGDGVVDTKDARGEHLRRRYFVHIETALAGEEALDDAVISVPADGVQRTNFGRDVVRDLSTTEKQQAAGYFPLNLLLSPGEGVSWIFGLPAAPDAPVDLKSEFHSRVLAPAQSYSIPAIELDKQTSKSAVATVFEKVNTGGLTLNVFELLTATFAGDASYFARTGSDFRLNDDWEKTQEAFRAHPVLRGVENTDFLQAVTVLTTLKRKELDPDRRVAVSAKREDVLKLQLDDYLEWVEPLRAGFLWSAQFLADQHIFDDKSVPYTKQLVPMAALHAVMGNDINLHGVRQRITQWFWCGVLGELYGGAIETRFARDLEQVPAWAAGTSSSVPRTVQDATFVESRLHSLRTRNSAAYKGIHALVIAGATDWMRVQPFDMVQYKDMAVDIHHIFPKQWCIDHGIDADLRDSIVNKTALSAATNRAIGGAAPSSYLRSIEKRAGVDSEALDALVSTSKIDASALRDDDFIRFFSARRDALVALIEAAMGKDVQRDVASGEMLEAPEKFEEVLDDTEVEVEG